MRGGSSDGTSNAFESRSVAFGVLLVAATLRLFGLASAPLTAPEAGRAWFAWTLTQSRSAQSIERLRPAEPSALLETIHAWTISLGADGELAARLPGALAGVLLVAVLLGLAPWLGKGPALLLGALAAVDPALVAISRRQGDLSLSLLVGVLVLVPLLRRGWAEGGTRASRHFGRIWPLGFAALVASGWGGWAMLPLVVLGLWVRDRRQAEPSAERELSPLRWGGSARGVGALGPLRTLRTLGTVGTIGTIGTLAMIATIATIATIGTTGALAWPLLPDVSIGLTSFLEHFGRGCPELPARATLRTLLLADPVALLGGPLALIWAGARGGRRLDRRFAGLAIASFWGLGIVVATRAAPEAVGFAVLPLLAAIVYASALPAAKPGKRNFLHACLAVAIALSTVISLRALGPERASPWRDLLAPPADLEVRLLAADLHGKSPTFGWRRLGERLAIEIAPWPDPLLGWYLRGLDSTWVDGPLERDALGKVTAILTRGDGNVEPEPARFGADAVAVGRQYRIRIREARGLASAPSGRQDRWREEGVPRWTPAVETVTLWALVGGEAVE